MFQSHTITLEITQFHILSFYQIFVYIRFWGDYDLRKTYRRTKDKTGSLPGSISCSLSFQLPHHFYARVIAFVGFLYPPNERSIRKTRFPSFITYVQRAVAPVIERLVRTIVTPWSGITWAYYVSCNCTVDVITTRCLCAFALPFAIMRTNSLWPWTILHFSFIFYLLLHFL